MGRRAGVTAEETREQILASSARVFGRRGYEGASIAEISSEAGLSSGAIYAHYGSKAELFIATLRKHTRRQIHEVLGVRGPGFVDALATLGSKLDQRSADDGSLLIEAIVAGQRDPEVARLLVGAFAEREDMVTDLVREAQHDGAFDPRLDPQAVSRFTLVLALGSLLAAVIEMPPIDHTGWSGLIDALVDRGRPATKGAKS
jgi:AcrR family transcriptional regulator